MIDLSSLPPPLPSSSIDWYSHYYYRISYQYSSSYPLQKSDPLLLIDPANPPSLSPSKLIKKRRLSSSDDDDDNDNNNDYYYECDDRGGASDHIPIIMGGIKMEGGELFQNSISNSNNINNSDGNNDNNNNDQQQQNCLYHYQYDYNTVNNNNHHNNNNNNNNNNTSPSDPTDTIISPSTTTDCISTDEWDNSSDPFYSSIAPHLASSESDFSSSPLSDYYDADLFSSLPPSGVEELPPLSIEWINNNNNNNTFNNNNNNNYSTTTNNKLQLDLSIFSQSNTMRMEETPRSLPSFTPAPAPAPAVTASVSTPFSSSMSLLSYPDLSDDIKSRLSHQINLLQSLSYLPNPNQYYSFSSSSLYQIAQQFIHKINNQSLNLLQRYLTPSPSLLNNNNNNNNTINTTTNNNNDSSTVRAAASKAGVPHNHTPILTASAIYLSLHLVSLTNDNNNDYNNNNNSSNNNNNTTISISNFSLLDYYFRDHLPSHRELSRLLSISQSSLQQCSAKIKEKLLIQFSNKQGGGIIEKIKKKKAKFI